ncbi:hypothetical protein [Qipengyuania sphaerica]|uniref:hypothetical protein n=1 Tax=Qipengyuania sphaerica TaxID=2867243 RepID=UPI001C868A4A|nr:hypothetical protein [Qipengyuania sphaerica]MBX7541140.1 hypothetical protein [Qipengyuania sphaerica]
MKIIKSLELLLYELMVWLVFYPLTLFKSIFHPLRLMDYADDELDDEDDDRYSDTLSPPIFLAITLGLIHLVELTANWNIQTEGFLADDRNLIAFRMVAFSLFPLMFSLRLLRSRKIALDRKTLREPFYAQCFIAAPFAIGINTGTLGVAGGAGIGVGFGLILATLAWYVAVQSLWFRANLQTGWVRSFGKALRGFFEALIIVIVLGVVINAV